MDFKTFMVLTLAAYYAEVCSAADKRPAKNLLVLIGMLPGNKIKVSRRKNDDIKGETISTVIMQDVSFSDLIRYPAPEDYFEILTPEYGIVDNAIYADKEWENACYEIREGNCFFHDYRFGSVRITGDVEEELCELIKDAVKERKSLAQLRAERAVVPKGFWAKLWAFVMRILVKLGLVKKKQEEK